MPSLSRRELLTLLAGASLAPLLISEGFSAEADPWDMANLIRSRIKSPVIPDWDFLITDFGARGVLDLRGFEHAPIQDVNLSGIVVQRATMPSRVSHVKGLRFNHVLVNGVPVIKASDLRSLRL